MGEGLQLVRIARGKQDVVATGSRAKLQSRMRQLRKSTMRGVSGRGGKKYSVTYRIEAAKGGRE